MKTSLNFFCQIEECQDKNLIDRLYFDLDKHLMIFDVIERNGNRLHKFSEYCKNHYHDYIIDVKYPRRGIFIVRFKIEAIKEIENDIKKSKNWHEMATNCFLYRKTN